MFHRSNTRAHLVLGLAVAALVMSSAQSGASANERASDTIPVAARDLDLRTHTGAASLRHRVVAAAYKVCEQGNPGVAIHSDAFGDCVNEAVRHASRQVETLIAAAQGTTMLASAAGPSR